ncbi:MAG: PAS domain S-box protein [Candidatus Melainabacteria bacterium]|nr:PAS domain S-box protein [Candidatus Melainabacteria bacterium]
MNIFGKSLRGRGIAVVLIPVALQICTSIWLYGEFLKSKATAVSVTENKETLLKAQEIQKNVGDAVFSIFIVSGSQGLIGRDYYEEAMQGIRRDIEQLEKLSAGKPKLSALVDKVKGICPVLERLMSQTDKLGSKDMRSLSLQPAFEKEKVQELEGFHQLAVELSRQVEEADNEKFQHVKEERSSLRSMLLLALALSTLTSAVMAMVYSFGIERRLQNVARNAGRLSDVKSSATGDRFSSVSPAYANDPPIPVAGSDEIASFNNLLAKVESSIKEAKEKETLLVREAAALILSVEKNLQIRFVNEASYRQLGVTPEEFVAQGLSSIFKSEGREAALSEIRSAIENQISTRFEAELETIEGQVLDSEWSVSWSDLEQLLFCVVQDVSEQKAVERLRERFILTVGRDIGEPMETLRVHLQQLHRGEKGELSDKVKLEISRSASNINRLMRLLNDIVDMESVRAAKVSVIPSWTSVRDILQKSVDSVRAAADTKKVLLELKEFEDFSVYADADRIIQVLVNLLSNAIKFSNENSAVVLVAEKSGDGSKFSVSDAGKGIPPESQATIFKPFERLAEDINTAQGAGLGLSICKMIIESHGGTIGVESAPGKGSRFYFSLPGPSAEKAT